MREVVIADEARATQHNPSLTCQKLPAALLYDTARDRAKETVPPAAIYFLPPFIVIRPRTKSPAHTLLTKGVLAKLPTLGAASETRDPIVQVKWFTPDANWTWWVIEYDPVSRIGYGLVRGLEEEFGTFYLDEVEDLRGALGLPVERDLHFDPQPVSQVMNRA